MSLPPLAINLSYPEKGPMEIYISLLSELGVKRVSLNSVTLQKVITDSDFAAAVVKSAADHNITIFDTHAPHGIGDSLGNPLPGGAEKSTQVMLDSLRATAEIGAKVLTMHTARTRLVDRFAPESGAIERADLDGAVERSLRQLDVLLPEAEKLGVVIALENLFLPSSTAAHLMRIMEKARCANLGFCYDSGHALIVEKIPGKTPDQIAEWIAIGWDNSTMDFQEDQLDIMLNDVVTTHFHDNDGRGDLHQLPGNGVADWKRIAERINRAPRLLSVQSEVGAKALSADWKESVRKFKEAGFSIN